MTTRPTIDLNADLGEGALNDAEFLDVVTSANIACGGHAGTAETMDRTCVHAAAKGVVIGAHVSYVDREGFGRRDLAVPANLLMDQLAAQIDMLRKVAARTGASVRYVKAHGALYNRCAHDLEHSNAVADAVRSVDPDLALLCAPGSTILDVARAKGIVCFTEAFVDRAYRPDGTLVPRTEPDAVHRAEATCVAQALAIARDHCVGASDGSRVALRAQSLCVHGDNADAVIVARRVRRALLDAQITIASFL